MIHCRLNPDTTDPSHYAISHDAFGRVLIQLGDANAEQVRLSLSMEQARHAASLLSAALLDAQAALEGDAP